MSYEWKTVLFILLAVLCSRLAWDVFHVWRYRLPRATDKRVRKALEEKIQKLKEDHE